jgi:hypothetical protein
MREAEAAYYRDRATGAEQWLMRIHNEVEQTFFHKKERDPRYGGERSALGSHISDGAKRAR